MMIILTDLSEVLINGIYGVEKVIKKRYGTEWAKLYLQRKEETKVEFLDLMRGRLTEHGYWIRFMKDYSWPFSEQEIKYIISNNFALEVPGTRDVYERIIAYPENIFMDAKQLTGRPEIWIVSDHIAERENELRYLHPKVFGLATKVFWSYQIRNLKGDLGFFDRIIRNNHLLKEEVIFIDDYQINLTAAANAGIASIRFVNARQLEKDLKYFGFKFQPKKVNTYK
ncbi:hypothetical protein IKF30_02110 [Candidatus Saccharibacteria bacterium]|nr:hypothetical protein [Candidatus Saccharibacteria bacterium]